MLKLTGCEKNKDVPMVVSEGVRRLPLLRKTPSPLSVFREDLSLFTEEVLKVFKDRDSSSSAGQQGANLVVLLRKDLNEFRDNLSSVFKVGLTKERRSAAPEEQRNIAKRTSPQKQSTGNLTDSLCGSHEEQRTRNFLQEHEGTSVLSLFSPRASTIETQECSAVNMWNLKNRAHYLTLDPNTANSELVLSDRNRTATRVWTEGNVQHHPERFQSCPQVLCREGLLDSAYWEVEWSGGVDVGVAYHSLSRNGIAENVLLGHNPLSWSLECREGSYTPCHNRRRLRSSLPQPFSRRVGIHLDWEAESLTFYSVSRDSMTLLHTFSSAFREPLYAAFWVWSYGGSVTLHQVELDWERLQ